jgi:DNA-binding MarR family transcriptional regulator
MTVARDLSECADCLCLASRRTARTVTRAFDQALRPHGLRATQFAVLTVLALRGPLTIGALAGHLGSERTTLTRNLALLEREQWLEIRAGDDGRERIVSLTRKGRAVATDALPAWRQAQKKAQSKLGVSGADALRAIGRKSNS